MAAPSSSGRLTDFLDGLGRVVIYYPGLVPILGGVKPAILFGQLYWWRARFEREEFFMPIPEVLSATGFSMEELAGARRKLAMLGVLQERYARFEHRVYFALNLPRLNELWGTGGNQENPECPEGGAIRKTRNGPNRETLNRSKPGNPESISLEEISTKEDGMPVEMTPEMVAAVRAGKLPFDKSFGGGTRARSKPAKAVKSYADFKRERAAAPPPERPQTAEAILGADLAGFFRQLLRVYPAPNWRPAALKLAELKPGAELRQAILADAAERYARYEGEEKYKPRLHTYLGAGSWTMPLPAAKREAEREIRDDDIPAGAGSIVGRG